MRKHYSGAVVAMRGTGKEIIRTVYTDGSKYYVKWYGEFIEVENKFPGVTAGWKTVDLY